MESDREWVGLAAWEHLKGLFARAWPKRRAGSAREQHRLAEFRLLLLWQAWITAHPWKKTDRELALFVAKKFGICFVDRFDPERDPPPATDDWQPNWQATPFCMSPELMKSAYEGEPSNQFLVFWWPEHPCFAGLPDGFRRPNADTALMIEVWWLKQTGWSLAEIARRNKISEDRVRRHVGRFNELREKMRQADLGTQLFLRDSSFNSVAFEAWLRRGPSHWDRISAWLNRFLKEIGKLPPPPPSYASTKLAPPDTDWGRPFLFSWTDQRNPKGKTPKVWPIRSESDTDS